MKQSMFNHTGTSYKVSVIIPVYKVEKYIERCARSLFGQTMREGIEFIFVDDCSPDSSIDILQRVLDSYPDRIPHTKILRHEKNGGLALARITGTREARGEFIIHCDSDDFAEKDMYERLYGQAVGDNADVAVCDFFRSYDDREEANPLKVSSDPLRATQEILDGQMHNGLWNKLVHRSLYEQTWPWWTPGLNMFEDVALLPRLTRHARRVTHLREPLYHYNLGNVNAYTAAKNEESVRQILLASEILDKAFSDDSAVSLDNYKARVKCVISKAAPQLFRASLYKIYPEADSSVLWCRAAGLTRFQCLVCWSVVRRHTTLTRLLDLLKRLRDGH